MFDKLTSPLTESEEISYAHRNLLPRLHLAIHRADARSFAQPEYLAMNAEKGNRVTKAHRPPPNRNSQTPLCWNCRKGGHRHSNCPEPRTKFCFRCGSSLLELGESNLKECERYCLIISILSRYQKLLQQPA